MPDIDNAVLFDFKPYGNMAKIFLTYEILATHMPF